MYLKKKKNVPLSATALVSTICQDMLVPELGMKKRIQKINESQFLFSVSLRTWGGTWMVNKEL